jgi:hypothetical protein
MKIKVKSLLVFFVIVGMLMMSVTALAAPPSSVTGGDGTIAVNTKGTPTPLVIDIKNPGDLTLGFIRVDIPEKADGWSF